MTPPETRDRPPGSPLSPPGPGQTGATSGGSADGEGVSLALLDRDGVIVAVNDVWTDFCIANGGRIERCGPGCSYLDVCAEAGDETSLRVATAIERAVRGEALQGATLLLPCHSPTQERWYDLVVSTWVGPDARTVRGATVVLVPSVAPVDEAGQADRPRLTDHQTDAARAGLAAQLHRDVTGEVFASTLSICSVLDRIDDPLALDRIERGVLTLDRALARLRRIAVQLQASGLSEPP